MWNGFANGSTLGTRGSENGEILRDEERPAGARLTLEKNAGISPFAITCGIYGLMVHSRFFDAEGEAVAEFDKMKSSVNDLLALAENPGNDRHAVQEAIETFVETYP